MYVICTCLSVQAGTCYSNKNDNSQLLRKQSCIIHSCSMQVDQMSVYWSYAGTQIKGQPSVPVKGRDQVATHSGSMYSTRGYAHYFLSYRWLSVNVGPTSAIHPTVDQKWSEIKIVSVLNMYRFFPCRCSSNNTVQQFFTEHFHHMECCK
jgi:hypothetical protein